MKSLRQKWCIILTPAWTNCGCTNEISVCRLWHDLIFTASNLPHEQMTSFNHYSAFCLTWLIRWFVISHSEVNITYKNRVKELLKHMKATCPRENQPMVKIITRDAKVVMILKWSNVDESGIDKLSLGDQFKHLMVYSHLLLHSWQVNFHLLLY